ncbi:hypothetical protein Clacol_000162 [Clathrus columnatus]|uniref:F-box domain-containing protein n=1 Tax=Clathrus columnatus TaxID=1419009 RepID=A0AAV4ZZ49_9AGAM|nr:hypothetical protein Clacol_000162 [Clathrus columnatus]
MPIISSEEMVLSQGSKRNETEQEDRHENVLHNLGIPINRLPPEILIEIITLSLPGPPTDICPYPCLIFSWVCHRWRSVVLSNPIFWNRISVSYWNPMVKEIRLRSDDLPLDITGFNANFIYCELGPDANRVRMLRLRGLQADHSYPPLSHLTSLFPSLTILCLDDSHKTIDLSIEPLPFFQALKVAIKNLGNLAFPNHFPNLWWLQLTYKQSLPLIPLLEALKNLTCLRVLSFFPMGFLPDVPFGFSITFHHLEALITTSSILQLITAPKLSYLQSTWYRDHFPIPNENYSYFCGFDFSKITHIRVEINYHTSEVYIMGKFKEDTSDDDDMIPFKIKDKYKWAFDVISSSYPNEFYMQVDFSPAAPHLHSLFATIVKKSNNLDEIIFEYFNPSEWITRTDEDINFFLDGFRSAKKVRNLTVSGNDFVTFCGFLNDGTLCPDLERLAFSTQKKQDFLDPLLELMTERSKTCLQPLEVELTGFHTRST